MQGFELAAISVPPSDFHNFFEVATGHRRNAGIRAGGHLRGHVGFAKHFPGALARTQGALWNGKLVARSLGNAFAARKTDRLHIYKGFWAKVPGTLQICSDSGRRIWPCKTAAILACGHRRDALGPPSGDLEAENSFSKKYFFIAAKFSTIHDEYGYLLKLSHYL